MMLDADGACLSPNSKPHICEHCNAAFRSSYHLRRHVLIHTGERCLLSVGASCISFLQIHLGIWKSTLGHGFIRIWQRLQIMTKIQIKVRPPINGTLQNISLLPSSLHHDWWGSWLKQTATKVWNDSVTTHVFLDILVIPFAGNSSLGSLNS